MKMRSGSSQDNLVNSLIFATHYSKNGSQLTSLIRVGGISVLERQIRLVSKAGIEEIVVIYPKDDASVPYAVAAWNGSSIKITCIPNSPSLFRQDIQTGIHGNHASEWLVLDGTSLLDDRILDKLARVQETMIPALEKQYLEEDIAEIEIGIPISSASSSHELIWCGCARISHDILQRADITEEHQILRKLISQAVEEDAGAVYNFSTEPNYDPDAKWQRPFLFYPISTPIDGRKGTHRLVDQAQKRVLDWPAWYIHRPIENFLIFHICKWPVTPNQLTLITNIVAYCGMALFWKGWIGWAMMVALMVGVLDGLDGKQARIKLMTSKIGQLEHTFDKLYENGWYFAMAHYLSAEYTSVFPYVCFGILFGVNVADIFLGKLFRRVFKREPDDMGAFERKLRVVSGRRNTYIWTLLPFAVFHSFYTGYILITLYGVASIAIKLWRFFVHKRGAQTA